MTRYAAQISYDGALFSGWQVQPGEPTVQQAAEKALSKINGSFTPCVGAGRTDSGVHAKGQVCSFDMAKEWDPKKLVLAVNANLPAGVSLIRAAAVPDSFHARFSAIQREYRYFIWNAPTIYPYMKGRVTWLKAARYDWHAAAGAAELLRGTHDFKKFCRAEAEAKCRTTERTISAVRLFVRKPNIQLRIRGNGFLHNMVRIIMGNLEAVALGRLSAGGFSDLLTGSAPRDIGGRTFPPDGLYLWDITYKEKLW